MLTNPADGFRSDDNNLGSVVQQACSLCCRNSSSADDNADTSFESEHNGETSHMAPGGYIGHPILEIQEMLSAQ